MKRFIESQDRRQATLLPDSLEDYVTDDNPVRVIDVFIDELDLAAMGFAGVAPEATGRPAYHPATLLKIYLYGYWVLIPPHRWTSLSVGSAPTIRDIAPAIYSARSRSTPAPPSPCIRDNWSPSPNCPW